jgi:Mrp family chromosome partitioning ATPase
MKEDAKNNSQCCSEGAAPVSCADAQRISEWVRSEILGHVEGGMEAEVFSATATDHANYPRNIGPMIDPDGHARITGPCGDTMEFWLRLRDAHVEDVTFLTDGCGSSMAAGSMATCLAKGKLLEEVSSISQKDILDALEGLPEEVQHCALLASNTLKAACADLREREAAREAFENERQAISCHTGTSCTNLSNEELREEEKLRQRMSRIRRKIVVMSGKGGVGKSTVAVNLAVSLAMEGKHVGLLDIDIHGPSVPTMLGLEGATAQGTDGEILPLNVGRLKVLSMGFFLKSPDEAVIWRGPMKMSVIRQFLKDTVWGELDYLIIDSPPGTGDEPLSVVQLLGKVDGAVIVTTPQRVAAVDVRKSVTFCRRLNVPILGVVENMSGFACPECGNVTSVLRNGAGKLISEDMQVPFLGAIPIDPKIAEACDSGHAFIDLYADSPTAAVMREIIKPIASEL